MKQNRSGCVGVRLGAVSLIHHDLPSRDSYCRAQRFSGSLTFVDVLDVGHVLDGGITMARLSNSDVRRSTHTTVVYNLRGGRPKEEEKPKNPKKSVFPLRYSSRTLLIHVWSIGASGSSRVPLPSSTRLQALSLKSHKVF